MSNLDQNWDKIESDLIFRNLFTSQSDFIFRNRGSITLLDNESFWKLDLESVWIPFNT